MFSYKNYSKREKKGFFFILFAYLFYSLCVEVKAFVEKRIYFWLKLCMTK